MQAQGRAERHHHLPQIKRGDEHSPSKGVASNEHGGHHTENHRQGHYHRTCGRSGGAEGDARHTGKRPQDPTDRSAPPSRHLAVFRQLEKRPLAQGRRNEQSPSQEQRRDEKRVANDASPVDNGIAQKPLKADEQIDPSAKRGKSQKQTSPGAVKIHREEGSNFRSVVPFASRPRLRPRALTFLHKTLPQHSFVKAFTYYTSDLVALPKNNEAITCRNSDFTFSW